VGTWSFEPFGNDDAADWAAELEDSKDLSQIQAAVDAVLAVGEEYLEAPDATVAVAAIDVLARLVGSFGERTSYTEAVDSWVEDLELTPDSELIDKALQVIDRVLAENSELRELWEDSDDFEAWKASMQALRERVAA
jgi:hypothetical protein